MPDNASFVPDPTIDDEVVAEALSGLLSPRKTLPPKLFYDDEGCRLFGEITALPEYYLTRTELRLLETLAPLVVAMCPSASALVEYGASDEAKAEFFLRQRDPAQQSVFSSYVPIDVAETALRQVAARLRISHPALRVHTLAADFLGPVALPEELAGQHRLGFFPGSTIGNLEPAMAQRFLEQVRAALGPDSLLLVGVDLRKDPARLIPAYDDASGVTAAFNRNILVRLNREAGADFDVGSFSHRAVWNDVQGRIEMHLVSKRAQTVRIAGTGIGFAAGETIHTENSYKWTVEDFAALAGRAGWWSGKVWTDPAALFSIHLLRHGPPG